MRESLPAVHPSEYVDPLEESSVEEAIGVTRTPDDTVIAVGDERSEEWIHVDGLDEYAVKQ